MFCLKIDFVVFMVNMCLVCLAGAHWHSVCIGPRSWMFELSVSRLWMALTWPVGLLHLSLPMQLCSTIFLAIGSSWWPLPHPSELSPHAESSADRGFETCQLHFPGLAHLLRWLARVWLVLHADSFLEPQMRAGCQVRTESGPTTGEELNKRCCPLPDIPIPQGNNLTCMKRHRCRSDCFSVSLDLDKL